MIIPQVQVTLGCNLACDYCFQEHADRTVMSEATLSAVIAQTVDHNRREAPFLDRMEILWHGGEPLLAGTGFFRKIVEIEGRYPDVRFDNLVQTNGIAMTDEMARLLVEHRFDVGFSLDGPEEIHDRHRLLPGGRTGSYRATMRGIETFRKHSRDSMLAAVATITRHTVSRGARVLYDFFRDLRATVQLQPYDLTCHDLARGHLDLCSPCMPDADAYGRFVIDLFDLWFHDDPEVIDFHDLRTEIKFILRPEEGFDSIPDRKRCSPFRTIIDPHGRVFSCDQYVNDDRTALGDITHDSLDVMLEKKDALWERIKHRFRKGETGYGCTQCRHNRICGGGCLTCMRYNSLLLQGGSLDDPCPANEGDLFARSFPDCGDSYYCSAFRMYRDHIAACVKEEMASGN